LVNAYLAAKGYLTGSDTDRATNPIWSSSNPIGTERLHDQYVSMPNPDTVPATEIGGRPVSQRFADLYGNATTTALGFVGGTGPKVRQFGELVPGELDRVSTRIPDAAPPKNGPPPTDPHTTAEFQVGLDSSKDSAKAYDKNALNFRDGNYPDLPLKGMRSPDAITETTIDHMKDNLIFLHDEAVRTVGQDTVDTTGRWYDGANKLSLDLADKSGSSPRQAAGMVATLSPQKSWYENADLSKRIVDIVNNPNQRLTPEMNTWATDYIAKAQAAADTPSKQKAADSLEMSLASLRRGQTFGEINDQDTKALFVRAFDEAHNTRYYPTLDPDGNPGDLVRNLDGSPREIAWGSFGTIRKALDSLNGDLPTISESLGGNHKVRSFYNNIVAPNAPQGDITIDTHAIAAAHMRPLGASDPVVDVGLGTGGSSSAVTGSKGAYGIYHEAYRRAADELGIQPRQLQSIAWEAIRGVFSPEAKRDASIVQQNADIWKGFRDGKYSADEARRMVMDHAGGMKPPSWWQPPPEAPTQ
jgi:hypothetical protein